MPAYYLGQNMQGFCESADGTDDDLLKAHSAASLTVGEVDGDEEGDAVGLDVGDVWMQG